eukprot:m.75852 g.75852  ORF g.75852 m.75852 type:complete len:325 (-) comp9024_c1_seq2:1151-2125(-)
MHCSPLTCVTVWVRAYDGVTMVSQCGTVRAAPPGPPSRIQSRPTTPTCRQTHWRTVHGRPTVQPRHNARQRIAIQTTLHRMMAAGAGKEAGKVGRVQPLQPQPTQRRRRSRHATSTTASVPSLWTSRRRRELREALVRMLSKGRAALMNQHPRFNHVRMRWCLCCRCTTPTWVGSLARVDRPSKTFNSARAPAWTSHSTATRGLQGTFASLVVQNRLNTARCWCASNSPTRPKPRFSTCNTKWPHCKPDTRGPPVPCPPFISLRCPCNSSGESLVGTDSTSGNSRNKRAPPSHCPACPRTVRPKPTRSLPSWEAPRKSQIASPF